MRTLRVLLFVICIAAIALATAPVLADDEPRDLGRETLLPNDGWASLGSGVTGGSLAAPDHIYTVTNRKELFAALYDGVYPPPDVKTPSNVAKIIYVSGVIDFNVDEKDQPLTCADYYRNGYTLEGFLAAYDPQVWGKVAPSGPLEAARKASAAAQEARVRVRVGSNTTIVGLGEAATLRGAWFDLRGVKNVAGSRTNIIIRNLTFQDTFDCFPEWDPTDGAQGNWNSQYDSISLRDSDHVWVDHNRFEDLATSDAEAPQYFGRLYQRHDGQLDITNASDLVTASWNHFRNHDKVMLIGSSDNAPADVGKLRVTLHHNLFEDLGQRTPRVRYGQVHVYNNLYRVGFTPNYGYSWGVGKESAIVAQNNYFESAVAPDRFIKAFKGTAIQVSGTFVNGHSRHDQVDLLAAYNAVNAPALSGKVSWTPTLFLEIQPTQSLPGLVRAQAGPFKW